MATTAMDSPTLVASMTKLYTWTAIPNGNVGAKIDTVEYADMTVVIDGTFSVGGSCTITGSNDGTNFYDLTDPQGNAITKTAGGIEAITEAPRYVRPEVTAGDGSTSINVSILARRGSR